MEPNKEAAIAAGAQPEAAADDEPKEAKEFKWALFWRLLNYNKQYLWLMIMGLIAAGFTGTVFPLFSSFLSEIVVVLSSMKNSDNQTMPIYASKASELSKVLFIISALALVFQFIKTCSFLFIGEKLSLSLKKDVYRKMLFLPYPYHEKS